MTSKGNQGKTSFHLCEICGFEIYFVLFFLLEIRFGSKGRVAPVDDQTEVSSLLGKKKD